MYTVESIDTFDGARVFFNSKTRQTFKQPDHVFEIEKLTKNKANQQVETANAESAAKGWGLTFEVKKFEELEADENKNPFLSW